MDANPPCQNTSQNIPASNNINAKQPCQKASENTSAANNMEAKQPRQNASGKMNRDTLWSFRIPKKAKECEKENDPSLALRVENMMRQNRLKTNIRKRDTLTKASKTAGENNFTAISFKLGAK